MKSKQNPRSKFLILRNLITDYFAQDLERGRQNGFTLWNAHQKRAGKADSTGFIPMLILFLLLIAAVVYFAFTKVLHNQQ